MEVILGKNEFCDGNYYSCSIPLFQFTISWRQGDLEFYKTIIVSSAFAICFRIIVYQSNSFFARFWAEDVYLWSVLSILLSLLSHLHASMFCIPNTLL